MEYEKWEMISDKWPLLFALCPQRSALSSYLFALCPLPRILRGMPRKSNSDSVSVGLIQMSCEPKPEPNLKKAIARIEEAAKRGAQVVCLQELFRSQYFCQTEDI